MLAGMVEIVGLFLVVVGCGAVVAAAAMVSLPLAVLAAGVFLCLGGVLMVYVASQLEAVATKARATPSVAGADAGR